jgi:hypothetical protein
MTNFMALERLIASPKLCMLFRENKERRVEYHAIIGNIAITLSSHDATSSLRTEGQGTASQYLNFHYEILPYKAVTSCVLLCFLGN